MTAVSVVIPTVGRPSLTAYAISEFDPYVPSPGPTTPSESESTCTRSADAGRGGPCLTRRSLGQLPLDPELIRTARAGTTAPSGSGPPSPNRRRVLGRYSAGTARASAR